MSEKKFLNCILTEGFILVVLALCILILPKLTSITFGVMLSGAFIAYGIYKIVHVFVNKNYGVNIFYRLFTGIWLTVIGILLLFVPKISLAWLIALTGVYFILDGIGTTALVSKVKNLYTFSGGKLLAAAFLFLAGTLIILGIPLMSFVMVSILCGLAFLVKGISKIVFSFVNKNNFN